jgi:hypothetical protein
MSQTERAAWPIRVFRLGAEPSEDLSATTTVEERLAMVDELTRQAFALAGIETPVGPRGERPIVVRRLGE